jgi:hypothetical protein
VVRDSNSTTLTQTALAKNLLEEMGLSECKPRLNPLEPGVKLEVHPPTSEPVSKEEFPYLKVVGTLLYLVNCTIPDMAHAVGIPCRYHSHLGPKHVNAAKGLLRYLKGTMNMGISFKAPPLKEGITGYCDAGYAGDFTSRKPTTGWIFLLNGGAISWSSKLQPTVAQSNTESEYYAASAAAKEALYLGKLQRDFGLPTPPTAILPNNQSSLTLIKNGASSSSTKHIDVLHHSVKNSYSAGDTTFSYTSTKCIAADYLTKAVPKPKVSQCLDQIGTASIPS